MDLSKKIRFHSNIEMKPETKKFFLPILLLLELFSFQMQGVIAQTPDANTLLNIAISTDYKTLLPQQSQKSATDSFFLSVGDRFFVSYKLCEDGRETILPDGGKVYSMGFTAPNALFMDISYNHFQLADGGAVFICNPQNGVIKGPYTSKNTTDSLGFSTDILKGDSIVLHYYEPAQKSRNAKIELRCIVAGTKGFFNSEASAACLINTACEEAEAYRDIIQSVVLIYMDGYLCSGNLINNTAHDGTPYILTAAHCMEDIYAPQTGSWKFFFNIEAYKCNENNGPSIYDMDLQVMTGCKVIARGANSDFLLLKLNQEIPLSYHAYYCGWDRRNQAPGKGVVGIHHPHGDYKKFCKTTQTPTTQNCSSIGYDRMAFWYFYWEQGICEQGSSGSGLFNAETARLIGTLTAINNVGCSTNLRSRLNWYGKLSYHWFANNEISPDGQLRPWLDPVGSNALYIDGSYRPSNSIKQIDNKNVIQLFPNPSTDWIQVQFPDNKSRELIIYSADGRKIKHLWFSVATAEIFVGDLAKGLYIVKVQDCGYSKFIKL